MNLPVTNPIVRNVPLDKIEVSKLFLDLYDKKFEGYIYLIIQGKFGFEETIVIFSGGQIVGDIFLMPSYDVELYGKDAISLCLNAFGAKMGILNLFGLSQDQTKLILLFNDRIKYVLKIIDKQKNNKLKDIKYNEKLIEIILTDKIVIDRSSKEILNDFDLNDLLRE